MEKELIRTLRLNGTTLRIYDIFSFSHGGKYRLAYEFKVGRKIIFTGEDFCASPCHAVDSLATAYSLLSFLCLSPGDTDKEYFENYTEAQMEWAKSDKCDYLQWLISDWEEKNGCN